ncbi:MAG: tetratricopeptide repeat protein [Candidatus Melainabacteria bacterium]
MQAHGERLEEGISLYQGGQLEEALTVFQDVAAMAPHAAEAHLNLGNAQFKLNLLDQAEASWRKALELDPLEATGYINLGNLYFKQEKYEQAILYWQNHRKLVKNNATVCLNLGIAYDKLAMPDKALECYSLYIGLDSLSQETARLRARFDKARQAFENNVRVAETLLANPSEPARREAIGILENALSAYPGTNKTYKKLASLLYQNQNFPEALKYYLKAYELAPTDAPTLINLGVIYEKLQQTVDSLWAFGTAAHLPCKEKPQLRTRFDAGIQKLVSGGKLESYLEELRSLVMRQQLEEARRRGRRLDELLNMMPKGTAPAALTAELAELMTRIEEGLDPATRAGNTYFAMAQDAEAAGRFDQAMHFYRQYLVALPEGKHAREIKKKLEALTDQIGAVVNTLLQTQE